MRHTGRWSSAPNLQSLGARNAFVKSSLLVRAPCHLALEAEVNILLLARRQVDLRTLSQDLYHSDSLKLGAHEQGTAQGSAALLEAGRRMS